MPRKEAPTPQDGRDRRGQDLTAFIAVLVVGVILIVATHAAATTLAAYSTAVAALYAAWRRH